MHDAATAHPHPGFTCRSTQTTCPGWSCRRSAPARRGHGARAPAHTLSRWRAARPTTYSPTFRCDVAPQARWAGARAVQGGSTSGSGRPRRGCPPQHPMLWMRASYLAAQHLREHACCQQPATTYWRSAGGPHPGATAVPRRRQRAQRDQRHADGRDGRHLPGGRWVVHGRRPGAAWPLCGRALPLASPPARGVRSAAQL